MPLPDSANCRCNPILAVALSALTRPASGWPRSPTDRRRFRGSCSSVTVSLRVAEVVVLVVPEQAGNAFDARNLLLKRIAVGVHEVHVLPSTRTAMPCAIGTS